MNVLVRRCALAALGAVTASAAMIGGATLGQSNAYAGEPSGPLAELSIHGPGTARSSGTQGTVTFVPKPKGGGTSNSSRCEALITDFHTLLKWAALDQAAGNVDDANDESRFAAQLLTEAEHEGCT
jgi:hypothetical protein